MNLPLVVDIAIGLIFIYLVLSLLTSEIQELITTVLQWRAVHLKESIEGLLAGGNETEQLRQARILADRLYTSPVINTLNQEAKGIGASLPRQFTQAIGKFIRDLFKLDNVFGERKSGPSFMASESFATSFLDTLGIPLIIQRFTLLRIEDFNSKLTTQVGEALQNTSIEGINDRTLDFTSQEDEPKLKDYLRTVEKVSNPDQTFPILQRFYNFKDKLGETVKAFQSGGFDLVASVDRIEEVLIQYIAGVEAYFNDVNSPQPDLIKNFKKIQISRFGIPKIDDSSNSAGGRNWSSEKTLLLRSWQPNLTEAVEIVKGFWQLKRSWSAYKRIREGAAIDAVSQLTDTIKNNPNLSDSDRTALLKTIEEKVTVGGSDYGYDRIKEKIKEILNKYPRLSFSLDDVNSIIENTYEQIKELIEKQLDTQLPDSVKNTLLQTIDTENRKGSLYSLTYEFEKVRRSEIEKLSQNETNKTETTPEEEGKIVSTDEIVPSYIDKIEDIIEVTDEIIEHSYQVIKSKILDEPKLSSSNKQNLLRDIDNITIAKLDIEYETIRKAIENQPGIYWSIKQDLLQEVDKIINGFLKEEYNQFEKTVKKQPDLNLSVKQSLLLLATAITLQKDSELARLVDQLLGMGSLPESVERNLFLLAQQAQVKVDGVKEELNQFRKEVENWFDKSMERSEGVYKRNAKLVAIIIGSVVAVAVNADTIHIVSKLSQDQILRTTVIKAAESIANSDSDITAKCLSKTEIERAQDSQCKQAVSNIDQATRNISLPIGWGPSNRIQQWEETKSLGILGFIRRILGWCVSGIALSMGASFWYELLGKFMNVRNTGKVPTSSKEQANVEDGKSK